MSKLIIVASYLQPALAHLAKERLEAEGIPVVMNNANIVGVNWMYATAVGGVTLRVREEDERRALAVLDDRAPVPTREDVMRETPESPDDATLDWTEPDQVCPQCGSADIEQGTWKVLSLLASLCFTVPVPIFRRRMECRACKHTWKPHPRKTSGSRTE